MKHLDVKFTDTPEEEIAMIQRELSLASLANSIEASIKEGTEFDEQSRIALVNLLVELNEMFSLELPEEGVSPEIALRKASRDINLSRVLREKGLVRLYRLVNTIDPEHNVPIYKTLINPYTGNPFERQEDIIDWFCREAHVARSTVFQRKATLDRMTKLGFTLQEAFTRIIKSPYAFHEILKTLGEYDRDGNMIRTEPETVLKVANRLFMHNSDEYEELEEAVEEYQSGNQTAKDMVNLIKTFKPMLVELVDELSNYESTRDMMETFRHDVMDKPEIIYTWEGDVLIVAYIQKAFDPEGTEYIMEVREIPFIPDIPERLPKEIHEDLTERLPMSGYKRNQRLEQIAQWQEAQEEVDEEDVDNIPF